MPLGARALLRLVRVTGVHLLQVNRAVLDEEPDTGVTLERWLVLPALVGLLPAGNRAEIAAQWVVGRGPRQGVRVRKPQASAKGFRIVAARSRQPLAASAVA